MMKEGKMGKPMQCKGCDDPTKMGTQMKGYMKGDMGQMKGDMGQMKGDKGDMGPMKGEMKGEMGKGQTEKKDMK